MTNNFGNKPISVSSLLNLPVVDTYNKSVGSVTDIVLESKNYKIKGLITSNQQLISINLIQEQKSQIKLNIADYRLEQHQTTDTSNSILFSSLNNHTTYDASGEFIGNLTDIIPSPDGNYLFILKKTRFKNLIGRIKNKIDIRYIVPKASIRETGKKKIFLSINKNSLVDSQSQASQVHLEIETHFREQKLLTDIGDFKKRYLVLEASIETVAFFLRQKQEDYQLQAQNLYIRSFNSKEKEDIDNFVKIFNLVLMTSPDTYVPLTEEQAVKHFSNGTILGFKNKKLAAYVCTILEDSKTNDKAKIGVIAGIGIHPNQRGKKISFPMLSHSIEWLINQKDVMTIQCDVFENNFISKSLFESLGFKAVDEIYLD